MIAEIAILVTTLLGGECAETRKPVWSTTGLYMPPIVIVHSFGHREVTETTPGSLPEIDGLECRIQGFSDADLGA